MAKRTLDKKTSTEYVRKKISMEKKNVNIKEILLPKQLLKREKIIRYKVLLLDEIRTIRQ